MRWDFVDWLWALLWLVCIYLFTLVLAAVIGAFFNPAHAEGRCAPPDPAARPVIRLASGELRALAALAWGEARGEPDSYCSMVAVAAVVVNRVQSNPGYFGATVTQAINRPFAFSVFGKMDPNRKKMTKVDESDEQFIVALLAAIAAVSGTDPVQGADHFFSGRPPRWASGMVLTARIGQHTFMRSGR
jgi:spore germination cell wall hydrolase CwlJ-like protein